MARQSFGRAFTLPPEVTSQLLQEQPRLARASIFLAVKSPIMGTFAALKPWVAHFMLELAAFLQDQGMGADDAALRVSREALRTFCPAQPTDDLTDGHALLHFNIFLSEAALKLVMERVARANGVWPWMVAPQQMPWPPPAATEGDAPAGALPAPMAFVALRDPTPVRRFVFIAKEDWNIGLVAAFLQRAGNNVLSVATRMTADHLPEAGAYIVTLKGAATGKAVAVEDVTQGRVMGGILYPMADARTLVDAMEKRLRERKAHPRTRSDQRARAPQPPAKGGRNDKGGTGRSTTRAGSMATGSKAPPAAPPPTLDARNFPALGHKAPGACEAPGAREAPGEREAPGAPGAGTAPTPERARAEGGADATKGATGADLLAPLNGAAPGLAASEAPAREEAPAAEAGERTPITPVDPSAPVAERQLQAAEGVVDAAINAVPPTAAAVDGGAAQGVDGGEAQAAKAPAAKAPAAAPPASGAAQPTHAPRPRSDGGAATVVKLGGGKRLKKMAPGQTTLDAAFKRTGNDAPGAKASADEEPDDVDMAASEVLKAARGGVLQETRDARINAGGAAGDAGLAGDGKDARAAKGGAGGRGRATKAGGAAAAANAAAPGAAKAAAPAKPSEGNTPTAVDNITAPKAGAAGATHGCNGDAADAMEVEAADGAPPIEAGDGAGDAALEAMDVDADADASVEGSPGSSSLGAEPSNQVAPCGASGGEGGGGPGEGGERAADAGGDGESRRH